MSRTLRIVGRARTDVDDIFDWLVRRSISGAVSWYAAFERAVEQIEPSPEQYGLAPEFLPLRCNLRRAFFKTRRGRIYRIIFQFDTDTVVVLRVRGPGQAPLRRRDVPEK